MVSSLVWAGTSAGARRPKASKSADPDMTVRPITSSFCERVDKCEGLAASAGTIAATEQAVKA
jgi:hypothetical protein